jgi:hypothetical protein
MLSMDITGKILEYEYENAERYKLLFGINTVTWECLAGSAVGSSGTDSYGAIEITPTILFISWSMDDGEVVSIVANFQNDILHCCNTREGRRNFWKGNIKRFTKASIDHA